jgi:hypothetical protein
VLFPGPRIHGRPLGVQQLPRIQRRGVG